MSKEKKITIKHFLNKRLRPRTIDAAGERFPAYTNVTYNRQTTALNLLDAFNEDGFTEAGFADFLESIQDPVLGEPIRRIENNIHLSIRYEEQALAEGFKMKDFSKRLEVYLKNVTDLYRQFINQLFAKEVEPWLTVEQYRDIFRIPVDSYDFLPQGRFMMSYFKTQQRYIPEIQQRIFASPNISKYEGYAQWINFENMKGKYLYNPYRNTRFFFPNRFSIIEWVGDSKHQEYVDFLEGQISDSPYEYRTTFPITYEEEYENGLIKQFPARPQHLQQYIQQLKAFVPALLN